MTDRTIGTAAASPPSLFNRLSLFALIAFIPVVLGLVIDGLISRQRAIDDARNIALREVTLAAVSQQRQIGSVHGILATLSTMPVIAKRDARACGARLRMVMDKLPNFANFGLLDESGYLVCSANWRPVEQSFRERDYFKAARDRKAFSVGAIRIGHISRSRSIIFGYPVLGEDGQFKGVIFAIFKDEQVADIPLSIERDLVSSFEFYDHHGMLITAAPRAANALARQLGKDDLVRARTGPAVMRDIVDGEGNKYMTVLGRVQGLFGADMFVRGIVAEEAVLESWRASLVRRTVAALLALLSGLALTWWFWRKWLLRDLFWLVDFSRSADSRPVRTLPIRARTAETGTLMHAVVEMAINLQAQKDKLLVLHEQILSLNTGLEQRVAQRTLELANSENRYRTLAETVPQIVWCGTVAGGCLYVNQAWTTLVGDSTANALDHGWWSYIHPDDGSRFSQAWHDAAREKTAFSIEYRLRTVSGEYRHVICKAAPVFGADGTIELWVGINSDVTELKHAQDELLYANKEMESFSYSVSHDLRAPLQTIEGYSHVLLADFSDGMDEQARRYLTRIHASSKHMAHLIDDLLGLARIARSEFHFVETDLTAICAELVHDLRELDPDRNISIDIEPGMRALADPRLLRIALTNLISNAWKFTGQREHPTIAIGQSERDGATVYFVKDNGAGFDMRYAHNLFGVFRRLHSAKDFPGTGVGLATVQRIITRHHGKIWAHAVPNGGATFFFTIGNGST